MVVDRERFSGLISKMLSGRYETLEAPDGLQAVRRLQERAPDAIVVEMSILYAAID